MVNRRNWTSIHYLIIVNTKLIFIVHILMIYNFLLKRVINCKEFQKFLIVGSSLALCHLLSLIILLIKKNLTLSLDLLVKFSVRPRAILRILFLKVKIRHVVGSIL